MLCIVLSIPTGMKYVIAFPYTNVFMEEILNSNPLSMEMSYPLSMEIIEKMKKSEQNQKKEIVSEEGDRVALPGGATRLDKPEDQQNKKIFGSVYIVTKESFARYNSLLRDNGFVIDQMSNSYVYTKGNIELDVWVSNFSCFYKSFSIKGYYVDEVKKDYTVEIIK